MSKTALLNMRIEEADHAELMKLAKDDRRKLTDYIRIVLSDHIKAAKSKRPKPVTV